MDNTSLVRFLKDARSGKVQQLDREILDLYGLTEAVFRITNDELCERLIAEYDRHHRLRAQASLHHSQYQSAVAALQQDKCALQVSHRRWSQFLLGWIIGAVALLMLSLLGPDLDGFAAGWVLSLSSLLVAPKLKAFFRFVRNAIRVVRRLAISIESSRSPQ